MPNKVTVSAGVFGERLQLPFWIDAKSLAANTAETYTVPSGTVFLLMSGTSGFYINPNGTAAAPGDTTDGSASMYIPSSGEFKVAAGTALSVMSTSNAVVTFAVYKN